MVRCTYTAYLHCVLFSSVVKTTIMKKRCQSLRFLRPQQEIFQVGLKDASWPHAFLRKYSYKRLNFWANLASLSLRAPARPASCGTADRAAGRRCSRQTGGGPSPVGCGRRSHFHATLFVLDGEPRIKYTGHMKMILPPMAKPASWRVNARHSTHTI